MPAQKRYRTKYPGIFYILGTSVSSGGEEKVFYATYRKKRKSIEEKIGRQFQDSMTPAKASRIRSQKIDGKLPTNRERQVLDEAKKQAAENIWNLDRLWTAYKESKADYKTAATDQAFYNKHLEMDFGDKQLSEIVPLDIDRLKRQLDKKKKLKPQTVKHVLALLVRIGNYAENKQICAGLSFKVEFPKIDNEKTEDLNADELNRLLDAIEKDGNIQASNMMKMVLYTGMRRSELFKLKWNDVDFDRGFIHIVGPKGKKSQKIPLNDLARELLLNHERPYLNSPYVFPGRNGNQRVDVKHQVNRIKKRADLPKDFRPLHGLRHAYASMLASSGQVDLYTLQKLLTHKSPQMTQRYAHLRDDALRRASDIAGDIIERFIEGEDNRKVVNLEDHKI
jgi:integrase